MNKNYLFAIMLMSYVLSGCSNNFNKLANSGATTPLSHIQDERSLSKYRPIIQPTPAVQAPPKPFNNSLWRNGSNSFFKDARAKNLGDILMVQVNITDNATMTFENKGANASSGGILSNALIPTVKGVVGGVGLAAVNAATKLFNKDKKAVNDLDTKATRTPQSANTAKGETVRSTTFAVTIPATIIQILPNGNFVISGRQETRLNNEVRIVHMQGIVRKCDIDPNNTITDKHIAQLRISMGGKGPQHDTMHKPAIYDLLDAIDPFS